MLTAGVIRRDAVGRLVTLSPGATIFFNGGTPAGSLADLQVVASAAVTPPPGVPVPTRNYALTAALPADVTFTRASVGTYFSALGVLSDAAINAPRFDYDPVTLEPLGLRVEEARVNSNPNNTMVGAVPGTPGTPPTGWTTFPAPGGGARTVVGTGVEAGIEYIDIRWTSPTATVGSLLRMNLSTGAAALQGQSWTSSMYVRLVGGSMANVTNMTSRLTERDNAGAFLAQFTTQLVAPGLNSATLRSNRPVVSGVLGNVATAFVTQDIGIEGVTAGALDFTLRIGLPQLEQGAFASSVIKTNLAVGPRAADDAVVQGAAFSSFWNQTEGTLGAVGRTIDNRIFNATTSNWVPLFVSSAGVAANAMSLLRSNSQAASRFDVDTDLGSQAQLTAGPLALSARTSIVGAYKLNDFAASADGGAAATDSLGDVPALTGMGIGSASGYTNRYLNGWLESISYWNTRLTSAQLQSVSAPPGVYLGGLLYDDSGALVVANGGAIAGYAPGGMPVTSTGALCVTYGGTPVRFLAGIPFDASGRVCMVAPAPPTVLHAFDNAFDQQAFA